MLIRNLSNADYHKHPSISSSNLKKFLSSTPKRVRYLIENPDSEPSDALIRGSILHALILEPHTIDSSFIIERNPLSDKTKAIRNGGSKETWEAMKKEAEAKKIPIIKHEIWLEALEMQASMSQHELFPIFQTSEKEVSLFAKIDGVPCQARYDAWNGKIGAIIDIKTTRLTLTTKAIQSIIANEAYHLSAAMYLAVGQKLGLGVKDFYWCFIENFPPYQCRFVKASRKMLDKGLLEFNHCLEIYKRCKEENHWPSYPRADDAEEIDLPDWYINRDSGLFGEI